MYTVKDVMEKLEYLAPVNIAESWDNVGVLIGADDEPVSKIMCALDINDAIVDEAIEKKVDCIVTHHPFIFSAFKKIDYNTPIGRNIRKLIMNKISVISMHTNFDSAFGGINDIICKRLNITGTKVLNNFGYTEHKYGLGRFGMTTPITLDELISKVKSCFGINHLRLIGTTNQPIKTISVCSGSGSTLIGEAAAVSQVFITGDMKFHEAQDAISKGLVVLDVGHYASEQIAIPYLKEYIENNIDVEVVCTKIDAEVFSLA
ncbi:MAG: Nif3-like dinuclear metal center hexameric protein [Epulopiscium sp. Nele67-Bin004]|nr:MAG: Nif3-like dinuclear metal center hexameric protein [Epulopiscium sp. Nele67-Bin004]